MTLLVETYQTKVETIDLQAVLEAAGDRATIHIPNRVCKLAGPVNWTGSVHIKGSGLGSTLLVDFDSRTDAITLGDAATTTYQTILEDIRIVSTAVNKCQNALVLHRFGIVHLRNVTILCGAAQYGLVVDSCIWPDIDVNMGYTSDITYVRPANGIYVKEQTSPVAFQSNAGRIRCVISALSGIGIKMGDGNFNNSVWEVSGTIENVGSHVLDVNTLYHLNVHDLYATDNNTGGLRFTDCEWLHMRNVHSGYTGNITYINNCRGRFENSDYGGLQLDSSSIIELSSIKINNSRTFVNNSAHTRFSGPVTIGNYAGGRFPPMEFEGLSSPVNFAPNAGFEVVASPPEAWTSSGGTVTWSRAGDGDSDTTKHFAPHCCKAVLSGSDTSLYYSAKVLSDNLCQFLGKYLTATVWINTDTVSSVLPYLKLASFASSGDRYTESYVLADVSAASAWVRHYASVYVPSDATSVTFTVYAPVGATMYLAEPTIQLGTQATPGYVPTT